MRLNEGLFEDSSLYEIKGYYDSNFMELDESDVAYDLEDAFEIAWEYLSNGDYVVEIVDTDTGKRIVWEPDILDEFDGEFPYDNMTKLMQKSVERNRNMRESIRRPRKMRLKESLPKGKKGRFITDMYNAVSDVILKYEVNSWEDANTGDFEPSKKDIEFALDVVKRKLFASDYYEESLTNKPRRALKESESSFYDKVRFLNMVYQRHPADMEKWFEEHYPENPDIYLNDLTEEELDDIINYLGLNFMRESIRRPRKKSLKESYKSRRTVNESLKKGGKKLNETLLDAVLDRIDGEPYNPREFYDYVNGWYNDVAHEMDEGEEEDVANAIIRGLKDSLGFIGSNPDNVNAQQLYKFVKDSTWLTNGKTGETPDYIKQLQNTMNEDVRKEWKPNLNFKHIKDVLENALSRGKYVNNEREEVLAAIELCDKKQKYTPEQRKFIRDSHEKMWKKNRNESLKEYIDFETLSDESLSLIEEGDHLVDGNEDWQILEIEVKGNRYLPKAERTGLTVMNKNGMKKYATAKRFYGYKIVENDKAMNEDLEPEAIDEPEKAEITWVDDSGEQKVSTVELINKSFPETALKFSKEHNDCSIINCTAPLKGAQREDEPEKVALKESEETDGLANLISNEINGEFETTNGYRNLRQAASEVAPDMLPVIDDIMDEENTHVGQLQTLLSMVDDSADNIDVGAEEAEDQLEDEDVEIEHNDEVDVDFADIKKSDDEDADLEVKDDFDFDDEPFDEE